MPLYRENYAKYTSELEAFGAICRYNGVIRFQHCSDCTLTSSSFTRRSIAKSQKFLIKHPESEAESKTKHHESNCLF